MNTKSSGASVLVKTVQAFVDGLETGAEFENRYMSFMRSNRDSLEMLRWNSETDDAFDRIFTAVDMFCTDADLRRDGDYDEHQLRAEIVRILGAAVPQKPPNSGGV